MAELPTGNWEFWLWVERAGEIWCPAVSKNESVRRIQYKTSRKCLRQTFFWTDSSQHKNIHWYYEGWRQHEWEWQRIDRVHSFSENSPESRITNKNEQAVSKHWDLRSKLEGKGGRWNRQFSTNNFKSTHSSCSTLMEIEKGTNMAKSRLFNDCQTSRKIKEREK